MKRILVLGAGRSSASLIEYLLQNAAIHQWHIVIGDLSESSAMEKLNGSEFGSYVHFEVNDEDSSTTTISGVDLVISLLPAFLHPKVALYCLVLKKHLITASYVSPEMEALHTEAFHKDLLFLNECGLDPGIDHMSAVQVMDRIKNSGGALTSFESFTGGLIAPETDPQNPWRYKFTWNPRNVVMAGQGTARYFENGKLKLIPYQQLFSRVTKVSVPEYGLFEGYANRDSLKYIDTYGLSGIGTMLRGTLRFEGFCSAWNILVQLGCCDDSTLLEGVDAMTHYDFITSFLPGSGRATPQQLISELFHVPLSGPELERLTWSGFFNKERIGVREGTPAQITEHILNKKWSMSPDDKDLVVMWHRFRYKLDNSEREVQASLVSTGDNAKFTAMAKTVGLPLGIAAKLILHGQIRSRGVVIPILPEIYHPILSELKEFGIQLHEIESEL